MTKKIFFLLGAVFFMGMVILWMENPFEGRFKPSSQELFFPQLVVSDVAAVEIIYFTRGTRLEKNGEEWSVQSIATELTKKIELSKSQNPAANQYSPQEQASEFDARKNDPIVGSEKPSFSKSKITSHNLYPSDVQPLDGGGKAFAADSEKVEGLLDLLATLSHGQPSTTDETKQKDFKVDDVSSTKISAYNNKGEVLASLHIGKQGPDPFSTFVRLASDKAIYLVDDYLPRYFSFPFDEWKKPETPTNPETETETESEGERMN